MNSAKQEMNEVMYGGASRWPSVATKGRARADGSRLRPLRFAAVVGGGGARWGSGLPGVHVSVHDPQGPPPCPSAVHFDAVRVGNSLGHQQFDQFCSFHSPLLPPWFCY